ncbi:glycine/D-amino acid oxidase-like deaminating enzyme [Mycoplana sp. BE70]|uniref:NAD(P)/FAD-dependent oxidoreductase n=1 Tax=Mycoplana sp. BE70 TaxID=2817775 RepID=UPI0028639FB2|nr:FAD-binding oxidoreductase [Mycoplana sp. BE70]MDR6759393.1 glycine/D-amino acid oxidase-like deaminating enzyme [Mycoplana sp. BE70]
MAPRVNSIAASEWTGEGADVVIIGGGIIGCSTALFLAERGISTVLLEKAEIACEQSSRNWGWCRTQGRDVREIPLILESMRLWQQLDAQLGGKMGFKVCGTLNVFTNNHAVDGGHRWLEQARDYEVDCRMLSSAEVGRLVPGHQGKWREALYAPTDGRAEPSLATPAIAERAMQAGARIYTHTSVRGIELSGGRVSGVVLDHGRLACSQVVVAGGAWSSALLRPLGIRLPQLAVTESTLRTEAFDGGPDISIKGGGFSIRKRLDGGYTVGFGSTMMAEIVADSFRFLPDFLGLMREEWRSIRLRVGRRSAESFLSPRQFNRPQANKVLDPAPIRSDLAKAWRNLQTTFPGFRNARIAEQWAGMIDVTPDGVPVISRVDAVPGLMVSTGYSGHGFGLGPGAGRLTADLVANDNPIVDPHPFSISRFRCG